MKGVGTWEVGTHAAWLPDLFLAVAWGQLSALRRSDAPGRAGEDSSGVCVKARGAQGRWGRSRPSSLRLSFGLSSQVRVPLTHEGSLPIGSTGLTLLSPTSRQPHPPLTGIGLDLAAWGRGPALSRAENAMSLNSRGQARPADTFLIFLVCSPCAQG